MKFGKLLMLATLTQAFLGAHSFAAKMDYTLKISLSERDSTRTDPSGKGFLSDLQEQQMVFVTDNGDTTSESGEVNLSLDGKIFALKAFCEYDGNTLYSGIIDESTGITNRTYHVLRELNGKFFVDGSVTMDVGKIVGPIGYPRSITVLCEVKPVEKAVK